MQKDQDNKFFLKKKNVLNNPEPARAKICIRNCTVIGRFHELLKVRE